LFGRPMNTKGVGDAAVIDAVRTQIRLCSWVARTSRAMTVKT
jgi:hypothetical protein